MNFQATRATARPSRSRKAKAGSPSSKTITRNSKARSEHRDICQEITNQILQHLEAGVRPWQAAWAAGGAAGFPRRHHGKPYRGINILILWMAAEKHRFESPFWMTYRQATELGGQVRKGEKGTRVVYYGTAKIKEENRREDDASDHYKFLKGFTVFNASQIDNLPEKYQINFAENDLRRNTGERMPAVEAFIADTGANIQEGGARAYYRQDTDTVFMPDFERFNSPAYYYGTLSHELVHWTRHSRRLDRDFGQQRWGDAGYAMEELVAELGAAFIGTIHGFAQSEHIEDHASYLKTWIKALQDDKRAIFKAAAKAQEAVDFLTGSASDEQENAE